MSFGRPVTRADRQTNKPNTANSATRKSERWEPFNGWDVTSSDEDEDSPGLEEWTRARLSPTDQHLGRSNKDAGRHFLAIYPTDRCQTLQQLNFCDIFSEKHDNEANNNDELIKPKKVYVKPPSDFTIQQPALSGERRLSSERTTNGIRNSVPDLRKGVFSSSNENIENGGNNYGGYVKTPVIVNDGNLVQSAPRVNAGNDVTGSSGEQQSGKTQTWATYNNALFNNSNMTNSREFSVYKDVIKQHQSKSAYATKDGAYGSPRQIKSAPPVGAHSYGNSNYNSLAAITRFAEVYAGMKSDSSNQTVENGTNESPSRENSDSADSQKRTFVTALPQFRDIQDGCESRNGRRDSSNEPCQNTNLQPTPKQKITEDVPNKNEVNITMKKVSIQQALPPSSPENQMYTKGVKWTQNSSTVKTIISVQDNAGMSNVFRHNDVAAAKYGQNCQNSVGFKGGKITAEKMMRNPPKKERTQIKNTVNKVGAKLADSKSSKPKTIDYSNTSGVQDILDLTDSKESSKDSSQFNPNVSQQPKDIQEARRQEVAQRLSQATAQSRVDIASLMEICREQNIDYFPMGYLLPAVDSNIQTSRQQHGVTTRADMVVSLGSGTNGVVDTLVNERITPTKENVEMKTPSPKGFRGNTNRTPLQRARENAHKRLFGSSGQPRDIDCDTIKTRWLSASPHGKRNSTKRNMNIEEKLATLGLTRRKKESPTNSDIYRAKTAK